jgi:hypothetical protein
VKLPNLSDIHFGIGWQTASGFYRKTIRIPRNYIVFSLAILIGLAAGYYVGFPILAKMVADALIVGLLFGVVARIMNPVWKLVDGATV